MARFLGFCCAIALLAVATTVGQPVFDCQADGYTDQQGIHCSRGWCSEGGPPNEACDEYIWIRETWCTYPATCPIGTKCVEILSGPTLVYEADICDDSNCTGHYAFKCRSLEGYPIYEFAYIVSDCACQPSR